MGFCSQSFLAEIVWPKAQIFSSDGQWFLTKLSAIPTLRVSAGGCSATNHLAADSGTTMIKMILARALPSRGSGGLQGSSGQSELPRDEWWFEPLGNPDHKEQWKQPS